MKKDIGARKPVYSFLPKNLDGFDSLAELALENVSPVFLEKVNTQLEAKNGLQQGRSK